MDFPSEWQQPYAAGQDLLSWAGINLANQTALSADLESALSRHNLVGRLNAEPGLSELTARSLLDYCHDATAGLRSALSEAWASIGLLQAQEASADILAEVTPQGLLKYDRSRPDQDVVASFLGDVALHGCLSACTAALDVLAGVTAFVLGLPTVVRRASWSGLKADNKKLSGWQASHVANIRAAAPVSPDGWMDWLMAYRNVANHRGRGQSLLVHTPNATNQFSMKASLRRRPQETLVELAAAYHDSVGAMYLSEPAEVTLKGVTRNVAATVDGACSVLRLAWRDRLRNPPLCQITAAQWEPTAGVDFDGFEPDPAFWAWAKSAHMNPATVKRLEMTQQIRPPARP